MTAAVIVLSAVVIVLVFVCVSLSRNIREISRKLLFLRDNASNMRLTHDSPFPAMNSLVTAINDIIEKSRRAENLSSIHENELKTTITNLSHDIRTPLTSLDGYFQLLTSCENEEEKKQYIAVIRSRIASLKDILEELFTYTKLHDSGYELAVEKLELSGIVCDSLFMFYEELNSKNINPNVNISDETIFVQGNTEALHRIFHNIIKNAVDHGSGESSGLSFYVGTQGEYAVFRCENRVSNPEDIDTDRVFDRFYKSDKARTHTSTGLGLSIAKELTAKMNGTISASMDGDIFAVEVQFHIITEVNSSLNVELKK